MLKDSGQKEFADAQVKNLVIDVSSFSRNLEQLYDTRRAMARQIEKSRHKN